MIDCCSPHIEDPFWKKILEDCAIGNFPKGMRYDKNKNRLHTKYVKNGKSETTTRKLTNNETQNADIIIEMCTTFLDINPPDLHDGDVTEWKDIRSKTAQNQLLMGYAVKLTETYKPCQTPKQVYQTLQLGFQFKKLKSTDVSYANGMIESIKGVMYNQTTFKITVTATSKIIQRFSKSAAKKSRLDTALDKWMREFPTQCIGIL